MWHSFWLPDHRERDVHFYHGHHCAENQRGRRTIHIEPGFTAVSGAPRTLHNKWHAFDSGGGCRCVYAFAAVQLILISRSIHFDPIVAHPLPVARASFTPSKNDMPFKYILAVNVIYSGYIIGRWPTYFISSHSHVRARPFTRIGRKGTNCTFNQLIGNNVISVLMLAQRFACTHPLRAQRKFE